MEIRSYKKEDYEALKKIIVEGGLYYEDMDSKEGYGRKITRDPDSVMVAVEENEIVGCVQYVEDGWIALAFRLAVKKEYQGQGAGELLMKELERRVKAKGYPRVHALVVLDKEWLHKYYQKYGWKEGGSYKWMYKTLE